LGLLQLPGGWIILPHYRDDKCGKLKRGGVTKME